MKIIADENIPFVVQAFSTLGEVKTLPGRDITRADLLDCHILLVRSITSINKHLLKGTAVQFVASATSGINHIDLDYLQSQNIEFAHAPGSNATSVAEYVASAIAYWSLKEQRTLNTLTIGIIGCGHVGNGVNQLVQSMGIKTMLNDPPLAESNDLHHWCELEDAIQCDIVSLHVPLTLTGKHATQNLINQHLIQQLIPGTLFINTSRGEVIDEQALYTRQKQQQDLSLVLDVWHNEPKINTDLLALTLLGTPHIAGYSFDGKINGTKMIYRACCEFLQQEPLWSGAYYPCDTYVIKPNKNKDMRSEILNAYDIQQDNNRLKHYLNEPNIAKHFDALRKNYPIRREWSQLIL